MREICCNLNHYNALSVCERILQARSYAAKKKIFHPTWFSFNLPCIFICIYLHFMHIFEKPFAILYLRSVISQIINIFLTFSIAKTLYFVQIFKHAIRRQIYTQFPAIEVLHFVHLFIDFGIHYSSYWYHFLDSNALFFDIPITWNYLLMYQNAMKYWGISSFSRVGRVN